jgi:hypothetical protein
MGDNQEPSIFNVHYLLMTLWRQKTAKRKEGRFGFPAQIFVLLYSFVCCVLCRRVLLMPSPIQISYRCAARMLSIEQQLYLGLEVMLFLRIIDAGIVLH